MSRLLALRKYVQAPELVLVATYNSSVDNLTLRLVVACIAQVCPGSTLLKPEANETPMIPGT